MRKSIKICYMLYVLWCYVLRCYVLRCYMSCDVMSCDVICLYQNTNHKKQKTKTKKKKVERIICIVLSSFLFYIVFFVTHFFILSLISIKTVKSIKRGKQIFKSWLFKYLWYRYPNHTVFTSSRKNTSQYEKLKYFYNQLMEAPVTTRTTQEFY